MGKYCTVPKTGEIGADMGKYVQYTVEHREIGADMGNYVQYNVEHREIGTNMVKYVIIILY